MSNDKVTIGHVAAIYRYPVKSMRGESLTATDVGWHGLAGDRRYAFLDQENRSGFPWLTSREFHRMVCYQARFENPADPSHARVLVKTPNGTDYAVDSKELLDEIRAESGRSPQLF